MCQWPLVRTIIIVLAGATRWLIAADILVGVALAAGVLAGRGATRSIRHSSYGTINSGSYFTRGLRGLN